MIIHPEKECHSVDTHHWQMVRESTDCTSILTWCTDDYLRPTENPFNPEKEVIDELGESLSALKTVILPPCSQVTIDFILNQAVRLEKLVVADWNQDRLSVWKGTSCIKENSLIELVELAADSNTAKRQLASVLSSQMSNFLAGDVAVYIPKRFRRLDPNLAQMLEKTTLRIQQKYCSDAAFRSLHAWHLTINKFLNLSHGAQFNLSHLHIQASTIVIVGAGPSLDQNVQSLTNYRDNVLIIATDASISTLFAHNIKPHLIVSMDDASLTWRFYANHLSECSDVPLIIPYEANHLVLRHYPGPVCLVEKTNERDDWFRQMKSMSDTLLVGRCVGHMAFHMAAHFRPKNLIMIGFDLAYKGNEFHSKEMKVPFNQGKGSTNVIELGGINGGTVKSDLSMEFYRDYFETVISDSGINVINATEGGAAIAGTSVQPLSEALEEFASEIKVNQLRKSNSLCESLLDSEELNLLGKQLNSLIEEIVLAQKNPRRYLLEHQSSLATLFSPDNPAYSLLSSCCSLLLISKFQNALNDNISLFSGIDDLINIFAMLLDDMLESGRLLSAMILFHDNEFSSDALPRYHQSVLLLEPHDNNMNYADIVSQIVTDKRTIITQSESLSLPEIWEILNRESIQTIVCFNSSIIPDTWSVPGIQCIDIKTSFSPKDYERSLWIPDYQIVCLDDTIFLEWESLIPGDIPIQTLKEIEING